MSRVGKKPIPVPAQTEIVFKDGLLRVKGQKGSLERKIHEKVDLQIEDGSIQVTIGDKAGPTRALQGLTRSLVSNMVTGVNDGFERVLEINGIGYRAEVNGNTVVLNLGYSHPINFDLPKGISAVVEKNLIKVSGIDKELIGRTAASIRKLRPPEPYKGKGIKYSDEHIQRKAGKTGAK